MIDDQFRRELALMRAEDLRVREELVLSGELGGIYAHGELGDIYVPRMEEVHRRNASRLRELIALDGWPAEDVAGKDGAEAALLIVDHAIGEPEFQRQCLRLLRACAAGGRVPAWHAAFLEDRIAMYEGRPQLYGTKWLDDPADGHLRPWKLADPSRVGELRAEVGLGPMPAIPERGPQLPPEERRKIEQNRRWWERWLADKGWRRS